MRSFQPSRVKPPLEALTADSLVLGSINVLQSFVANFWNAYGEVQKINGTVYILYTEMQGMVKNLNMQIEPNIAAFRESGTFIVPANVSKIIAQVWGGGGGGGGGSGPLAGGGGGGGAYALQLLDVRPGQQLLVKIGQGGAGGLLNVSGSAGGETCVTSVCAGGGYGGPAGIFAGRYDGGPGGNYTTDALLEFFGSTGPRTAIYSSGPGGISPLNSGPQFSVGVGMPGMPHSGGGGWGGQGVHPGGKGGSGLATISWYVTARAGSS